MGWFWRIVGAMVGALVALVYVSTVGRALFAAALYAVMVLGGTDADGASLMLTDFLEAFIGAVVAGYLIVVLLGYLLTGFLAAFNPNGPSALAPFLFLLIASAVMGAAGWNAIVAVRSLPSAAWASLVSAALFLLGHAVLVGLGYLFAAIYAPPSGSDNGGESRWRGYMIGLNAAMNVIAAAAVYTLLLRPLLGSTATTAALVIAAILGAVNLLATWASTGLIFGLPAGAAAGLQQAIETLLGWSNWLMPMSWIVTGLGAFLFVLSWFSHCVAALVPGVGILPWVAPADYSVTRVEYDGPTNSMILVGGAVGNSALVSTPTGPDLVQANGAFNMGCFVFTATGAGNTPTREHEIGHGLSLASFGGLFHYIGAVDENVFRTQPGAGTMADAYAERVAESNVVGTASRTVTIWT